MRISFFSIALNLLWGSSMISANPLNSLSRRSKVNYVDSSKMDVRCGQRIYTSQDLDTAAREVCSRVKSQTHCRDYISCYYIKKAVPAIPKVSIYSGEHFDEYKNKRSLLQWPLPKRNLYESSRWSNSLSWPLDPIFPKKSVAKNVELTSHHSGVLCDRLFGSKDW